MSYRLLCTLLIYLCLFVSVPIRASESQRVLLLNSWFQDLPWQASVERGLKERLGTKKASYDLFVENLDVGRFSHQDLSPVMADYLALKYATKNIDVVISEGLPAAVFLASHPDLLAESRKIYIHLGPSDEWKTWQLNETDITIPVFQNYAKATQNALNMTQAHNVFVIGSTDQVDLASHLEVVRGIFNQLNVGQSNVLKVEYLINLPLHELVDKVQHLPESSVIIYLPIFVHADGRSFTPYQVAEQLAPISHAPIFTFWDSLLGSGVVGGYMLTGEKVGGIVGQTILDLAKGQTVLQVSDESTSTYSYDWRALQRWNIEQSRVPFGAQVRFYDRSLFDEYALQILATFSALALFVFLSLLLFISNHKRNVAIRALKQERLLLEQRVLERTYELEEAKMLAEAQARTDPLTGINNRRAFYEHGEEFLRLASRYGHNYSVIMLDVDYFKRINDTYGHAVGDNVIKEVAKKIMDVIRTVDICGRLGGEEFAILFPYLPVEELQMVAERLRRGVKSIQTPQMNGDIKITISLGLAEHREKDTSLDDTLQRADLALYEAKSSGRDRIVMYQDLEKCRQCRIDGTESV